MARALEIAHELCFMRFHEPLNCFDLNNHTRLHKQIQSLSGYGDILLRHTNCCLLVNRQPSLL